MSKNLQATCLIFTIVLTVSMFVCSIRCDYSSSLIDNFCRSYPSHRRCMGVFAGGGKRSMPSNQETFDSENLDNNEDEVFLNELRQLLLSYKGRKFKQIK